MGMNVNKCIFIGRLAKAVNYTPANQEKGIDSKATFRLMINRPSRKKVDGPADTIMCVTWGARADNMHKFTSSGKEIFIEGPLLTSSTKDIKTGKWLNRWEVRADYIVYGADSNEEKTRRVAKDMGIDTEGKSAIALLEEVKALSSNNGPKVQLPKAVNKSRTLAVGADEEIEIKDPFDVD